MRLTRNKTIHLLIKWWVTAFLLATVILGGDTIAVAAPKVEVKKVPRTITTTTAPKVPKTAKTAKTAKTVATAKNSQAARPVAVTPVKPKSPNRTRRRVVPASSSAKTSPAPTAVSADHSRLSLHASKAMVVHENTGETLFGKNIDHIAPIASLTKLMTAMVVLDRHLPMEEIITIADEDIDRLKHSRSRLQVDTVLTRRETLLLALMSSENRAAAALARTYPGGVPTFVAAMNRKAQNLGMYSSHFADPTGLNSANVSTAEDLVKMVRAALHYEVIHEATTTPSHEINVGRRKQPTLFINTNRLVRSGTWDIGLSKTGYINEAGHCLVMQVRFDEIPTIMVLLGNSGRLGCPEDAVRIRSWLQRQHSG